MIRTIVSIVIALGLLLGVCCFEFVYVNKTFTLFDQTLRALYDKTEAGQATYEDGTAVQTFCPSFPRSSYSVPVPFHTVPTACSIP